MNIVIFVEQHELYVILVPGHYKIEGNMEAATLSKKARSLGTIDVENGKPVCETKAKLARWSKSAHTAMCNIMKSDGMVTTT